MSLDDGTTHSISTEGRTFAEVQALALQEAGIRASSELAMLALARWLSVSANVTHAMTTTRSLLVNKRITRDMTAQTVITVANG